mmetsp:Transcript_29294/g.46060  ORF Transcript_29294/g.46060 Transcript_29294/m.46060 type:complete len:89 (-) Transcript_29294:425-691(-)
MAKSKPEDDGLAIGPPSALLATKTGAAVAAAPNPFFVEEGGSGVPVAPFSSFSQSSVEPITVVGSAVSMHTIVAIWAKEWKRSRLKNP